MSKSPSAGQAADDTQGAAQQSPAVERESSASTAAEQVDEHGEANERQPSKKPEKPQPDWRDRQLAKLRERRREAESRAESLTVRTRELEAELAALRSGQPQQPGTAQPTQPKPTEAANPAATVEQLVAEREFNNRCNDVYTIGTEEIPDFEATVANVGTFLDTSNARTFMECVLDCEEPHKVLNYLGAHPEVMERIGGLSTASAIGRALARAEVAMEADVRQPDPDGGDEGEGDEPQNPAPRARQVLKPQPSAPVPPQPLASRRPSTPVSKEPSAKDDVTTWMRKRNAQIAAEKTRRA